MSSELETLVDRFVAKQAEEKGAKSLAIQLALKNKTSTEIALIIAEKFKMLSQQKIKIIALGGEEIANKKKR